jgi:hypothetical protein
VTGGTLEHFCIRNCFVHDVTGVVNWIGGDTADNATGVTFQAGWDASKRTGGIVFEVAAGTGTAVKTKFDDVQIESNTVQDTSFGGIVFKQLDGTVHWGVRKSRTDSNWTPHTNVVIRNNYLSQTNTAYGCNTIYLTDTQNALVEGNVAKDAGTCASSSTTPTKSRCRRTRPLAPRKSRQALQRSTRALRSRTTAARTSLVRHFTSARRILARMKRRKPPQQRG